jgi:S-DNA-T family DNA segregation ATPase FtsK/SpoIIIE
VVTEPKKAISALKWVVKEMENRYRLMATFGVRNIDGFNKAILDASKRGIKLEKQIQVGFNQATGEPMYEKVCVDDNPLPYIVVIVDEMADLMLVAGKDIEGSIQRLAQMARAAGIHLIMATQRPSVDVITGVIKANFPTRISFQVTSKIDSRTILGEQGAEQLLGMGDMLYMRGGGRIERVHGPFVDDREVEAVANLLRSQGQPSYIENITVTDDEEFSFEEGAGGDEDDALYNQALKIVVKDRKASTSYIQRCLRIGYNRAANIIDRMEREGIVSAPNHVGKREILMGGSND